MFRHSQNAPKMKHLKEIKYKHESSWQYSNDAKKVFFGAVVGGVAIAAALVSASVAAETAAAEISVAAGVGGVGGYAIGKGLKEKILKIPYEKMGFYLCYGYWNSQGCIKYYDCCNKQQRRLDGNYGRNHAIKGCVEIEEKERMHPCCQQLVGSEGCVKYYSCCNNVVVDGDSVNGCTEFCTQCDGDTSDNKSKTKCGYAMSCCPTNVAKIGTETDGCQEKYVCQQCSCDWGTTLSKQDERYGDGHYDQGCCSDFKNFGHDMQQTGDEFDVMLNVD